MIYKNAELYNIEEMIELSDKSGYALSRIPKSVRDRLPERGQLMAFNGCGAEIRFNIVGDQAKVIIKRKEF
jgi:hypothetical protein